MMATASDCFEEIGLKRSQIYYEKFDYNDPAQSRKDSVIRSIFTGMFAVPLQVFMQSRPPDGQKGRMIATQNLLNWIGIFLSTGIYFVANRIFESLGWPPNAMFGVTAITMLPIAIALSLFCTAK